MKRTVAWKRLLIGIVVACGATGAASSAEVEKTVALIREALPKSAPARPKRPRKVLIFTKTNGFRHASIPVAVQSLTMLGETTGAYSSVHTEDDSYFEPERLRDFDAVFMINTTGDVFRPQELPDGPAERIAALEREQRLQKSLVEFVKGGKGLCGTHSATDTYHNWKAYNDMMGGTFVSHPWHESVPVRLLDPQHPLNRVFGGQGFTIVDEIYQFRNDTAQNSERRMLLSLAPDWESLSKGNRDDGFYPISWIDRYGDGRIFYCSLGHRDEIYYNSVILEHYLAGFQFALGDLEADAEPLPERQAGDAGKEGGTGADDDPDVARARRTVKMLDDVYKTAVVLITDKYVNDESDFAAGSAAVAWFEAIHKKGWHEVRLLDATGKPYDDKNVARDDFDREAIVQLKAGKEYYEQVETVDGKRMLRAATPVPVVLPKCVMCHAHYADAKPNEPIGLLSYSLPIE